MLASSIFTFLAALSTAQPGMQLVEDPAFDQTIRRYLDFSVPVISCDEFQPIMKEVLILDAREPDEYAISHIEKARNVGYKRFTLDALQDVSPDTPIVVYCSIGYRSEKIAEKLLSAGYSQVYNLYGSIFEWVNQGNRVVDAAGKETLSVHGYNRSWSKWITNPRMQKVW